MHGLRALANGGLLAVTSPAAIMGDLHPKERLLVSSLALNYKHGHFSTLLSYRNAGTGLVDAIVVLTDHSQGW